MSADRLRLAILLSGRGSNFAAIHEAVARRELRAEIVAVVSNRKGAPGIERARAWGYDVHAIDNRDFPSRATHEAQVLAVLEKCRPDFIVLAGYMRLLSAEFVGRFPSRILNIHPSLLPSFPGVGAQAQAVEYGVRFSGCTVHFVDEFLDAGPIIAQRVVDVRGGDTAETLAARILEQEHLAYVEALVRLQREPFRIDGRRVIFGE